MLADVSQLAAINKPDLNERSRCTFEVATVESHAAMFVNKKGAEQIRAFLNVSDGFGRLAAFGEQRAAVACRIAKLFFNAKQLVVFGHSVCARSRACFDLPGGESNCQVSNRRIFRFTTTVAGDAGIAISGGQIDGFDSFGHRANLIHLDQNTIGNTCINTTLEAFRVGNEQVVTDQLNLVADLVGQ